MRRTTTISSSRHLDSVYDPLYLAGSAGPSYAAQSAHSASAASAASSAPLSSGSSSSHLYRPTEHSDAAVTVRQADGSLVSVGVHARVEPQRSSLRSAVRGPNRMKYLKRPLRAFVAPSGSHLSDSRQTNAADDRLSHSLTSASPFAGRLLVTSATQPTSAAASGAAGAAAMEAHGPSTAASTSLRVSVGSQSVYRESGSQTVPYSPDVLLDREPSADVLELLSLQSSLSFANGTLPAMLDAVEIVEAAREKAAWEAALPALSAVGGYERRKRMVEDREWTEWKAKEAAIRREQERAMLAIVAAADERDSLQQRRMAAAMEAKDRETEQRAAEADERRREEKRKAIRVLGKARLRDEKRTAFLTGGLVEVDAHSGQFGASEEKTDGGSWRARRSRGPLSSTAGSVGGTSSSAAALLELSRADAVFGAVDFSSEVYAPLQRNGAALAFAHKRTVVDFDIPALSDYDTLTALHNKAVQPETDRAQAAAAGGGGGDRLRLPSIERPLNRRESRERQQLMHVDAVAAGPGRRLHAEHATGASSSSVHSSPSVNVYKHFCPVQRAPTPSLPASQAHHDGHRVAVSLLQRLLRGRAQQNALLTAAARRQHLITEMVQVAQQAALEQRQHQPQQRHEHGSQVAEVQQSDEADEASSAMMAGGAPSSDSGPLSSAALLDVLVGSLLSDAVSCLLSSRQQSAALTALSSYMQQAVFVRRVREAEEAGRRQAQEELRQRQDEHYTSTQTALRQHTAAHHSHSILQRAIATYVQQRQHEQSTATVGEIEDADAVIADLLDGVLWPEVELRVARESVDGRRFVDAAHCVARRAVVEQFVAQQ